MEYKYYVANDEDEIEYVITVNDNPAHEDHRVTYELRRSKGKQ